MDRRLFETATWQTDTNWVREARAAHVPDIGQFRKCLMRPTTTARLVADREAGVALHVTGTPTFFGRYGFRKGVQSVQSLIDLGGRQ
jgi:protein-disulfide isomerase